MQENQKETSYSDGDVITEFDRYLFAEGTHYEIYKKLGAHRSDTKRSARNVFCSMGA